MEHDQNFTGTINRTAAESTIAWTSEPSPLRQRPNIVMIVLDDVGYAEFGCYGSDIEAPALDSLAADGLRYANFHVTPLCSPTRTCLLTGRNHHSVGMGRVAEMVNGFPNTRGFVSREAANLAEMLRPHGYQTLAAGKWHLGSVHENSPAGPYDHWPLQRGFDRFHGFMPGETNQWNPELIMGNERVEPPKREGYHLSEDIVDQSCKWLRQEVGGRGLRGFGLQRPMHALVASVLLWMAGLDALELDAEAQPPHQSPLGWCAAVSSVPWALWRRRLRRLTRPWRSSTACTVLTAGGLIMGYSRMSLSRILGGPQEACSRLMPRMLRSTWNGSLLACR